MKNVKMKWVVAICAVGLVLGGTSVASAIDLSTTTHEELVPMTSTDVTTISFDYSSGADGYTNDQRCIRIYGYYGDPEESQWMIPCKFNTQHPTTFESGDWFHVDSDYGSYWSRLGDVGTVMNTVHHFDVTLNRHNGLVEWRFDGVKLSFVNKPNDTNDPQPDGFSPYHLYGLPVTLPNTFFADEEIVYNSTIDPLTSLPYGDEYIGRQHARDLGWLANCDEYGVGGSGEYYLIFDANSQASVNNIRPGILGDANLDGTVDDKDASVLSINWLGTGLGWQDGDFNGDTNVNDQDAAILVANWGTTASLEPASVPEPSTWCLLAGALAMLALWRKR